MWEVLLGRSALEVSIIDRGTPSVPGVTEPDELADEDFEHTQSYGH